MRRLSAVPPLIALGALLGCARNKSDDAPPSEAAQSAKPAAPGGGAMMLREKVLTREILANLPPGTPGVPRCVVMDWNVGGGAVATLVAFEDGTTSLYFSSGGGIIGAGAHAEVREAAARFREQAAAVRAQLTPATRFDLPGDDKAVLYLVTDSATLTSGPLDNATLESGRHPLSAVAERAQEVITQVRRQSPNP